MSDILKELYEIVEQRKAAREEGSYTVYLFDAGLDKILKKLGEECSETIIAAKNLKAGEESAAKNLKAGEESAAKNLKAGEESAAKNLKAGEAGEAGEGSGGTGAEARAALANEAGDLIYHITVMLSELGVRPEEVEDILRARMRKTGNLKQFRETDKNT